MPYKTESPEESAIDKARRLLANEEIVVDAGSWRALVRALLGIIESVDVINPVPTVPVEGCDCYVCWHMRNLAADVPRMSLYLGRRMYVCQKCGKQDCPSATDHRTACTGSKPGAWGMDWID